VKLIRYEANRGKGFAVKQGVLSSRGNYILFSDADLSTPIEETEKLLAALDKGADVAIGSRGLPGSRVEIHQSRARETMGRMFNLVVRRLLSLPFMDTQCGFKAFKRSAARDLFSRQTVNGFAFDVEVLCLAQDAGYQVKEVPVRWRNHPETKVRLFKHGIRMLVDTFRVLWRRAKNRTVTKGS
jgi:dolichyl-phosphate beta-glucosyltransferase